jgi:hypothetical protein
MSAASAKTSTAATAASLEDFRHFHGMCCLPSTAKRCIDAFTGVILFMPHTYHHTGATNDNSTNNQQKKGGKAAAVASPDLSSQDYGWILSVWLYYALVVFSLTGLWTVLGKTKFLIGRQEQDMMTSKNKTPVKLPLASEAANAKDLVMHSCVIDYIQEQHPDSAEFYLVRRFEYDFVGLLQVIMLHISDNQGKLHLVEIFKIQVPLLAKAAAVVKSVLQSSKSKRD